MNTNECHFDIGPGLSPRVVVRGEAAPVNTEQLWGEAVREACDLPIMREKGGRESPAERLARLHESLRGELVAFHDRLVVQRRPGEAPAACQRWDVCIPLTLFPKRDYGFARIECVVEFYTDDEEAGAIMVVGFAPECRTRVLATAELSGKLELKTAADIGLRVPLPVGSLATEAAMAISGTAQATFQHQVERDCTLAEIVRGTGVRWRLEDLHSEHQGLIEAHQLKAVLEVKESVPTVHAAGCLQAYSAEKWLSMNVGDFVSRLGERVRSFFTAGAPTVGYGQWTNILEV